MPFTPPPNAESAPVEVSERHPETGACRYYTESPGGVWFTGWPRAGRWREILGRFSLVRQHADDPMRVIDFAEESGRVRALCVEIVDRRTDNLIVFRYVGEPFAVESLD